MFSDGPLVAAAGQNVMVRVWDISKVPTRGGHSGSYGNEACTTSSMIKSRIGQHGDGNDDDNGKKYCDDKAPHQRMVSCSSVINADIRFSGGGGGGDGMAPTTKVSMLGCSQLCSIADMDH